MKIGIHYSIHRIESRICLHTVSYNLYLFSFIYCQIVSHVPFRQDLYFFSYICMFYVILFETILLILNQKFYLPHGPINRTSILHRNCTVGGNKLLCCLTRAGLRGVTTFIQETGL